MAMRKGLDPERTRVKALILGPPKTGKTRFAVTFPKVCLFDFDDGFAASAALFPQVTYGVYQDTNLKTPKAWKEFIKDFTTALNSPEYETLVFDTLGAMIELAMINSLAIPRNRGEKSLDGTLGIEGIYTPAREDWNYVRMAVNNVLERACASDKHVVVLSHENPKTKEVTDDSGNKTEIVVGVTPDAIGKKDREQIQKRFDIFGRMEPKIVNKVFVPQLRLRPTTMVPLGSRWDCFAEFENPSFDTLWEKIQTHLKGTASTTTK